LLGRIAALQAVIDAGYCYRRRDAAWSVYRLGTTASPAKTAESIEMSFEEQSRLHIGTK